RFTRTYSPELRIHKYRVRDKSISGCRLAFLDKVRTNNSEVIIRYVLDFRTPLHITQLVHAVDVRSDIIVHPYDLSPIGFYPSSFKIEWVSVRRSANSDKQVRPS